jgi:hypothetical protein
MAENKVSVEITLEEKAALKALTQLTKEVQKTEDGFTKMGKTGESSLGVLGRATQGVGDGFGSLVKGVTVANLASSAIIGTANAVKNFVIGSINAAIEQEDAINRLNQALKASGDFSLRASQDFQNFASSMQQVSIFGDEIIIGQIAVAKSFGATNEQAKQLVQAAANLSATFGGSLESNVEKLGKTFSGSAGRLAQYIPELKAMTEAQLKAGDAFDAVNSKFAGAAANELTTYGGKVKAAENALSDLQEEMGRFVIENGYVNASLEFAKTTFTGLIAAQRAANELFGLSTGKLNEQKEKMVGLGEEYNKLTTTITELNKLKKGSVDFGTGEETNLTRIAELTTAIEQAESRKNQIFKERQILRTAEIADIKASEASTNKKGGNNTVDAAGQAKEDARVLKEQEVQALIYGIKQQALLADQEQRLLVDETNLGNKDLEIQQIYEFEALKLEAQFQAEEAKAALIKKSSEQTLKMQEIGARRELEFTKLGNAQIRAENQKKVADQVAINTTLLATASNFLGAGQLLAKEGSAAQKALQITQATISTYTAATNALAQPVPYPVALAMSASMIALGLANVAKISGAKFEKGGIVGGNSMTGDNVPARVNSGEMILNRQQQTELFNVANGGGGNSGVVDALNRLTSAIMAQPINVMVDSRAIATVVRKEVQSGFKIA